MRKRAPHPTKAKNTIKPTLVFQKKPALIFEKKKKPTLTFTLNKTPKGPRKMMKKSTDKK